MTSTVSFGLVLYAEINRAQKIQLCRQGCSVSRQVLTRRSVMSSESSGDIMHDVKSKDQALIIQRFVVSDT